MRSLLRWLRPRRADPWEERHAAQVRAVEAGAEVELPWIAFPGAEPWSFKQGYNEAWLLGVFLPFWRRQRPEERAAYLKRWPPPADYWTDYLGGIWT